METQMMFRKGDKAVRVLIWFDWNGTGQGVSHSITALTIESWGKKQATATHLVDGVFIQARIYTDGINKGGNWFFREGQWFNIEAMCAQFAAETIAFLREHRLTNPNYNHNVIRSQIARLEGVQS